MKLLFDLLMICLFSALSNPYHLTKVLRELRPRYIIMYDADVKFVRQVEVGVAFASDTEVLCP